MIIFTKHHSLSANLRSFSFLQARMPRIVKITTAAMNGVRPETTVRASSDQGAKSHAMAGAVVFDSPGC